MKERIPNLIIWESGETPGELLSDCWNGNANDSLLGHTIKSTFPGESCTFTGIRHPLIPKEFIT